MRNGSLTKRIDADRRFKVSKRLLIISSTLLVIHQLLDIEVNEVNLLIIKLVLKNQDLLPNLLMILTSSLLVWYFINARSYHESLYKQWTRDMINKEPFLFFINPYESDWSGLVMDLVPKPLNYEQIMYEGGDFKFEYVSKPIFKRYIRYLWSDRYANHETEVALIDAGIGKSLRTYWYELKHQFSSLFSHPEYFEIYIPYLLGFFALLSYFTPDLITKILTQL